MESNFEWSGEYTHPCCSCHKTITYFVYCDKDNTPSPSQSTKLKYQHGEDYNDFEPFKELTSPEPVDLLMEAEKLSHV